MINFSECKAYAAECQRMADLSEVASEKLAWEQMAAHWLYIPPSEDITPKPKLAP
jgi:hypothetical protein